MTTKRYGYVRVSTKDQNEDRQLVAMAAAGVEPGMIYMDKLSGKDFDRPQYKQLLAVLRPGDVLYVKSIDRLGRSYADILEQWRVITKEMQVDVVVLDMPLLDTRRGKDLMGTFLADIVLQVLSFFAENERKCIRQRQAEGIAAAKARGVRFGRPCTPLPAGFGEVYDLCRQERISQREGARRLNVPQPTFRRMLERINREKPTEE